MERIVFIDSSVLLNVIDVPGKNGERMRVLPRFRELVQPGAALLVIPVAAVIEVGNHIAQLSDGAVRRDRMNRLASLLHQALTGQPPWVVSGSAWDGDFLRALIDGHAHRPGMVDMGVANVGTGDGSILLELERYRRRSDVPSALPVELWSLDRTLQSWA